MDQVVERPGALDVHKAQVTACVRTPADVAGLAGLPRRHACGDGGHWRVLAVGVGVLEDDFELLLVKAT